MCLSMTRREWFECSTALGASLLIQRHSRGEDALRPETHVYKTVGPLQIKADVYRAPAEKLRPAAVWIHDGALIRGHGGHLDRRVKKHMIDAGYVLISLAQSKRPGQCFRNPTQSRRPRAPLA